MLCSFLFFGHFLSYPVPALEDFYSPLTYSLNNRPEKPFCFLGTLLLSYMTFIKLWFRALCQDLEVLIRISILILNSIMNCDCDPELVFFFSPVAQKYKILEVDSILKFIYQVFSQHSLQVFIYVYFNISSDKDLLPTPSKSHYIFRQP